MGKGVKMKKKMIQVLLVVLVLVVVITIPAVGYQLRGPCVVTGPQSLERPMRTPDDFQVAQSQVFPEGCFGYGFETWMVFYNSTDMSAKIIIVASGNDCYFFTEPFEVLPHQRITCDMQHIFITRVNDYFMYSPDVSFQILSNSKGVYAQESMYWNNREGGHTSTGIIEGEEK